jgi:phosphate:Na+ symporter
LETVIDALTKELKQRHIQRVQAGKCTLELGFIFNDCVNNFERVADHCSNIAVCLIQIHVDGFETHGYLGQVRRKENKDFMGKYEKYKERYRLGD